jgi:hypothetical protein
MVIGSGTEDYKTMRKLVSFTILAACALAVCSHVQAQACKDWGNWSLQGTYSMSGSGWRDLSKISPNLPAGMVPVSYVGMVTVNGAGAGTGWINLNLGGVQVTGQFLNLTIQANPDCTIQSNYSVKVKELGITIGPESRFFVSFPGRDQLEIHGLVQGTGPSTQVDLCVMRRITVEQ